MKHKKKRYGLLTHQNVANRAELIDQDYLHKLSEKELDWLNEFNLEWVQASFPKEEETRVHPKEFIKRQNKGNKKIKIIDKYKNDCETRNNARNRDTHSIVAKMEANVLGVQHIGLIINKDGYENVLNKLIDYKRSQTRARKKGK